MGTRGVRLVGLGGLLGIGLTALSEGRPALDPMLGLPPLPRPTTDHTERSQIELGRRLFFDRRLSVDAKISCASCHQPGIAFSDGRARSTGHGEQAGTRNAPSLLNVVYQKSLFWDGRAATLEEQAMLPLTNPIEHALADENALVRVIRGIPEYVGGFREAFGVTSDGINAGMLGRAIASYEQTLRSGSSRFDRYEYAGERNALSAEAARGLALFRGRAQCTSCHSIGKSFALFADGDFHFSPIGLPVAVTRDLASLARKATEAQSNGSRGTLERLIASDANVAALGRFVVTQDPADIGKYKTPSLRNVALTAPYMHDGSVATLKEAVDLELYGRERAVRYPIVLTLSEKADLIAFLEALTSDSAIAE